MHIYILPGIKIWVDSSTKEKMTLGQEPYLIEFYIARTNNIVLITEEETWRNLLSECTQYCIFIHKYNPFESMSFNLSLLNFQSIMGISCD